MDTHGADHRDHHGVEHRADPGNEPFRPATLLVDCDDCAVRGPAACADCVVPFILAIDAGTPSIADAEVAALTHLAEAGLVPPLRLVRVDDPRRRAG